MDKGNAAESDYKPVAVNEAVVAGFNDLGFALLAKQEAKGNQLISPASLGMALAMVENGAAHRTQDEMAQVMGVSHVGEQTLNQACQALRENWEHTPSLASANSLWLRKDKPFEKDFLEKGKRYFDAEIRDVDFLAPGTPAVLDAWVTEKTHEKITSMAPYQFSELTRAVLFNALYFKSQWQEKFDKSLTKEEPFHLEDGQTQQAKMMKWAGKLSYYKGDDFGMVKLPYRDKNYAFYVLLPNEGNSVAALTNKMSGSDWHKWRSEMKTVPGTIMLPRFKIAGDMQLVPPLQQLGMKSAFDWHTSDFSRMRVENPPLYIQEVRQKTTLEVDEEGAEAAAVTKVAIAAGSARPADPLMFKVDRPFLAILAGANDGLVLFCGVVRAPVEK